MRSGCRSEREKPQARACRCSGLEALRIFFWGRPSPYVTDRHRTSPTRHRRHRCLPHHYSTPMGTGPGHRAKEPRLRGEACVLERWPSEVEEPDCSGLRGGVISHPPPPMTLRAGPQGTGEPSREWGGSEASQLSQSPFRGGLSGNGMLPVFLQHLPPSRGDPQTPKSEFRPCSQLTFDPFFHQERRVQPLPRFGNSAKNLVRKVSGPASCQVMLVCWRYTCRF